MALALATQGSPPPIARNVFAQMIAGTEANAMLANANARQISRASIAGF